MIVAPLKLFSSPLYEDALRGERQEMVTPMNAAHLGGGAGRCVASHRNGICSLDDVVEGGDRANVLLGSAPTSPSHALGSSSHNRPTTPKRKLPHPFKQLANEFRWMHNNFKYGYSGGAVTPRHQQETPRGRGNGSFAPTPQTTREVSCAQDGGEEEAELLTMSVRSSLRRNQGAPASARDGGAKHTVSTKRSQKTRWRTMENGEVEAIEPPQLPTTTPDPFAPAECQYVLRHPIAAEAAEGTSQSASRIHSVSEQLSPNEDVTPPDAMLSESMLSNSDKDDGNGVRDSPMSRRFNRGCDDDNDSSGSDLDGAALRGMCPYDREVTKTRCTSHSLLDDPASTTGADADHCEDSYEAFLLCVAQLQRQLHTMGHQTEELRGLYARERSARLRSRGKGQHLSWTRTVEAANTIQFWRMKVHLLRKFDSLYVNAVQQIHHHLPLVEPETSGLNFSCVQPSGTLSHISRSRRDFLQSARVLTAQQQHVRALGEQLKSCWQANARLHEELRNFEQVEVRKPYVTFSVAGMDAEHFIASLPPRISAFSLYSASEKSSVRSMDSTEDIHAPRLLLTAQNLSPTDGDYDDEEYQRLSGGNGDGGQNSRHYSCAQSGRAPLVSCMKGCHARSPDASVATPPSSPKRLKYVIQSATFDTTDPADQGNNSNNSFVGRSSMRVSMGSRVSTPPTGALSTSLDAPLWRKRERHVTFALEPELLDARPRFSAHGRTVELLEQICVDNQAPLDGLALLQVALEECTRELTAMQNRVEDEQQEVLARAATMNPVCDIASSFMCESEYRETLSRPETAPSPTLTNVSTSPSSFERAKVRRKRSKVKPKECAQCSVV